MPPIDLSDQILDRAAAFQLVVEAVLGESISHQNCIELILAEGMDAILADLLQASDPSTLIRAFQEAGARHPMEIYGYLAELLRQGHARERQERIKRRLGFHPREGKS